MLPEWHHVCMRCEVLCIVCVCVCVYVCVQRPGYLTGVWARAVWSPWLVGDVGIRGRL